MHRRVSFGPGSDDYPVWSHDGNRIAFTRDLGKAGLFEVNADGTGTERPLLPPHKDFSAMIARGYTKDDRQLLVVAWPPVGKMNGGLFMLSLDREPRLAEFLNRPANEAAPRLSPDNTGSVHVRRRGWRKRSLRGTLSFSRQQGPAVRRG